MLNAVDLMIFAVKVAVELDGEIERHALKISLEAMSVYMVGYSVALEIDISGEKNTDCPGGTY